MTPERIEDSKALVGEIKEIMTNLASIKGKEYLNALTCVLNIINMNEMASILCAGAIGLENAKKMDTIANTIISDTIFRLAGLLLLNATEVEQLTLGDAIATDAKMIILKQKEYSITEGKEG